jgi:hypothetical protein
MQQRSLLTLGLFSPMRVKPKMPYLSRETSLSKNVGKVHDKKMVESPPVDTLIVALGEDGWLLGLHECRHASVGRDLRVLQCK